MEFFQSNRGGAGCSYLGYEYLARTEKDDGTIHWRCRQYRKFQCHAFFHSRGQNVLQEPTCHSHEPGAEALETDDSMTYPEENDPTPFKLESISNDEPGELLPENYDYVPPVGMEIYTSNRGGSACLYKGYRYLERRVKEDGTVHWRCKWYRKFRCHSTFHTKGSEVIKEPNGHSHEPDDEAGFEEALESMSNDDPAQLPEYPIIDDNYVPPIGVEICETRRGGNACVYKGFDYLERAVKADETIFWRCRGYKKFRCHSTFHTRGSEVIKEPSSHSHEPNVLEAGEQVKCDKMEAEETEDAHQDFGAPSEGTSNDRPPQIPNYPMIDDNYVPPIGAEILESKKGGNILAYKGYEYLQRDVKADGTIFWRCRGYKKYHCHSNFHTNGSEIIKEPGSHSHGSDVLEAEEQVTRGELEAEEQVYSARIEAEETRAAPNELRVPLEGTSNDDGPPYPIIDDNYMPPIGVEIRKSIRGGNACSYKGYDYLERAVKVDGTIFWRCRGYKKFHCHSTFHTQGPKVSQEPSRHSHGADVLMEAVAQVKAGETDRTTSKEIQPLTAFQAPELLGTQSEEVNDIQAPESPVMDDTDLPPMPPDVKDIDTLMGADIAEMDDGADDLSGTDAQSEDVGDDLDDDENMDEDIEEIRELAKAANRERLEDLSEMIQKTFSFLKVELGIAADDRDFIGVARKSLSGSKTNYFPMFHVAISKDESEDLADAFKAEMLLYNGLVVQTERICFDACSEDRIDSKLLLKLNCGDFRLCQGVVVGAAHDVVKVSDVYIEPLSNQTLVRSRECEWVRVGDGACSMCKILRDRVCPVGDVKKDDSDEDWQPNSPGSEDVDDVKSDIDETDFESQLTSKRDKTRCESNLLSLIHSGVIQVGKADDRPSTSSKSGGGLSITSPSGSTSSFLPAPSATAPFRGGARRGRPPLSIGRPTGSGRGRGAAGVRPKVVLKSDGPVNFEARGRKKVPVPLRRGGIPRGLPPGIPVRPIRRPPQVVSASQKNAIPRVMQECQICLYKNDRPHYFERHMESHASKLNLETPVNCPVCNKLFPTKQGLNPHFRETHDKQKGVCIECGEILPAEKLRRHLDYSHNVRVKNKLCSTCGKAFRSRGELEVHVAIYHEQTAQSVMCDVCGKDVPHPKLLEKHMQSHHGYNNRDRFRCPFCDKIFDRAVGWHRHVKTHSRVKPYRCGFCEYRSVKRYNIMCHMKKLHKPDATYNDIVKDAEFDYGVPIEEININKFVIGGDT